MLIIHDMKRYNCAINESRKKNIISDLLEKLLYLSTYGCDGETNEKTKCHLYTDSYYPSMSFSMEKLNDNGIYEHWFSGGLVLSGNNWGVHT